MSLFPLDGSAPSTLLTRLDVSDIENVREARHRLRACVTEADYASWAATWGENLCARVEEFAGSDPGDETALEEAESAATAAEKSLAALRSVVEVAVSDLDDAAGGAADKFPAAVEAVACKLEGAL